MSGTTFGEYNMERDFHVIDQGEVKTNESPKKRGLSTFYINSKYKIMASLYNYVHHFPTELPHFTTSPIFMLGQCYRDESYKGDTQTTNNTRDRIEPLDIADVDQPNTQKLLKTHINEFLSDFHSLLWFCYRKDFPPLEPSQLTTDIGWGCMLRTGQMMLAKLLVRHTLGSEWRLSEKDQMSPFSIYRQIVRWFADSPSPKCPYSIHSLVNKSKAIDSKMGININKVGEWFTPTRVSQILKHLVRQHSPEALTMYVSRDGGIYTKDVERVCTRLELYECKTPPPSPSKSHSNDVPVEQLYWRPVFVVVPVRLGLEKINKVYIQGLKALLRMPQSIGAIGGRPRQSLYFVGYQDDDVFYLDPHTVRPSVKMDQEFPLDAYHCSIPGKMSMENIDPSLAIGFYCANRKEFESFCHEINELGKDPYPIITIGESSPDYLRTSQDDDLDDAVLL